MPSHYLGKAKAGDPQAQFYLGLAIERLGPDAAARWGDARDWFEKAAAGGLPEARLRLGQLELASGNAGAATMHFVKAAIAGDADAQFNAARLAAAAGNASSALRWYKAAAAQDHGPAQFNLALLLLEQPTDAEAPVSAPVDALAWLTRAASADVPNAAEARDIVRAELTAAEIAQAERLAAERGRP